MSKSYKYYLKLNTHRTGNYGWVDLMLFNFNCIPEPKKELVQHNILQWDSFKGNRNAVEKLVRDFNELSGNAG